VVTEMHHMLPDGTVHMLACDGKKVEEAIVLTPHACMEREIARVLAMGQKEKTAGGGSDED